jgi:hypothetical protein
MTYKKKKRVLRTAIIIVITAIACYRIGYHYGVRDATQEVSDELLVACEQAIDRHDAQCEEEKAEILAQF